MAKGQHRIFYLCCLILIVLFTSAVLFFIKTNKTTYNFVESITLSVVNTQVSQFDLNLENQTRILKAIGEEIPDDLDTNSIEETSKKLETNKTRAIFIASLSSSGILEKTPIVSNITKK